MPGQHILQPHILIAKRIPAQAATIAAALTDAPYLHTIARTIAEIQTLLQTKPITLIVTDYQLPDGCAFDLLPADKAQVSHGFIIMGETDEMSLATQALNRGALEWLPNTAAIHHQLPHIIRFMLREWHLIVQQREVQRKNLHHMTNLAMINRLGNEIAAALDLEQVINNAVRLIHQAFHYHHVALFLLEENVLHLRAIAGSYTNFFPTGHQQATNEGINGCVATQGRKIVANDVTQEPCYISLIPEHTITQAETCLPITVANRVLGILDIQSPVKDVFTPEDVTALEILSDQIAIAIENARLYEAVKDELEKRKQVEAQLLQAQKMETIGTLTAGIAHDFNNLLTVVNGFSELSLEELRSEDPLYDNLQMIHSAGRRAADLVEQLLIFSRKQVINPSIHNLNTLIQNLSKMLRRIIGENINLVLEEDPNLWQVNIDHAQIEQVVVNLVVNARDAMRDTGGQLTIRTKNIVLDDTYVAQHPGAQTGEMVCLGIIDTGTGMDTATQARIFEPFFTTKKLGYGTGLGLATVYGIAQQNKGYIDVQSTLGQGTVFRVYFPRAEQHTATPTLKLQPLLPVGDETILVVEDDDRVRKLTRRILLAQGYKVLLAANGVQAKSLAQLETEINLLITDVVMADTDGKVLADELRHNHPNLKVLFMSGYADEELLTYGIKTPEVNFLQKPFTRPALVSQVRTILDTLPSP